MRISSSDAALRAVVLDQRVPAKHRVDALLSIDRASVSFLRRVLRIRKIPASVAVTAAITLKSVQKANRKEGQQ